jgi:hypothetical protein
VPIDEPNRFQGHLGSGQIAAANQQVDVTSCPHSGFVGLGHPGAYSIAANDGVRNARGLQCGGRFFQSEADFLHGAVHPFPKGIAG